MTSLSNDAYNGCMFPIFNPRAANVVLGMAIGLSLALVYHWIAWTVVH